MKLERLTAAPGANPCNLTDAQGADDPGGYRLSVYGLNIAVYQEYDDQPFLTVAINTEDHDLDPARRNADGTPRIRVELGEGAVYNGIPDVEHAVWVVAFRPPPPEVPGDRTHVFFTTRELAADRAGALISAGPATEVHVFEHRTFHDPTNHDAMDLIGAEIEARLAAVQPRDIFS